MRRIYRDQHSARVGLRPFSLISPFFPATGTPLPNLQMIESDAAGVPQQRRSSCELDALICQPNSLIVQATLVIKKINLSRV